MQSDTSLVSASAADEAYGLVHRACMGSVLKICMSRKAEQFSLTAVRRVGFEQPKKANAPVTKAEWDRLKEKLERANFWALPERYDQRGLDGWTWTIEGRDGARSHSSECFCPRSGAFHDLGSLFVEMSHLSVPYDTP